MKILIPFLFLLISSNAAAQLTEAQLKQIHQNTSRAESSRVQLEAALQESQRHMDSINLIAFNEQNTRNLSNFMAARKEQNRKQRLGMYWRLGFGTLMLIVLVVAWRRKKSANNTKQ